jgi:hypothetical protein
MVFEPNAHIELTERYSLLYNRAVVNRKVAVLARLHLSFLRKKAKEYNKVSNFYIVILRGGFCIRPDFLFRN